MNYTVTPGSLEFMAMCYLFGFIVMLSAYTWWWAESWRSARGRRVMGWALSLVILVAAFGVVRVDALYRGDLDCAALNWFWRLLEPGC